MKRSVAALTLGILLVLGPASTRAAETHGHSTSIEIVGDRQFDRAHGVRSGKGTPRDPFVISGLELHSLSIRDTTKAVRIARNTIHGTLTLNWTGPHTTVVDNHVEDLRVNENIERWGAPTSGSIMHNHFDRVSQLRHFDGMFMRNIVGTPQETDLPFFSSPVVNFDGFNGAHFAYNTIYGSVAAQLHGHHHSSRFGSGSHMHTAGEHAMTDHTRRFHEVWIHHNRIISDDHYALAYLDTIHSANDRTASSERNPELEAPHIHWTRVHLTHNVLEGAGILVDVFNAADELHPSLGKGLVEVVGNRVTLPRSPWHMVEWQTGIEVRSARGLTLRVDRNTITAAPPEQSDPMLRPWEIRGTGISLLDLHGATVSLSRNRIVNTQTGIQAREMTRSVTWTIERLSTAGVPVPVSYDESVANKPRRR